MDLPRLCQAIQRARLVLRRPREEVREAVRQFVGFHYSENGTDLKVPVNLLSLYVSVVGPQLISNNPRVMLSTFNRAAKPVAAAMQAWVNRQIEHMRLADTLRRDVTASLFSMGITKVALATPADAAHTAWNLTAGMPFAKSVSLDDWVHDVHARSPEEFGYCGHRLRVHIDVLKDSKVYNAKATKHLEPSDDKLYNREGDERLNVLGRLFYTNREEYDDFVDVWEIYLPRYRKVVTLADSDLGGPEAGGYDVEPLRVQDWIGPDTGPYHLLGLGTVLDNVMPKAPIQDLIDLAENHAAMLRKILRTTERIKELTFVTGSQAEDGQRLMNANDGDIVPVTNPQGITQIVSSGNTLQRLEAVATMVKDLYVWAGGNLDMIGGLSPQSKTLGQDQLLAANAGRAMAEKQERVQSHVASVVKALCWYYHKHPTLTMKVGHSVPGLPNVSIQRQVAPAQRQDISFEELDIRCDPYSLPHSTPQSRLQGISQVMQQMVLPLMPLLQQQGISVDLQTLLKKVGEYMDEPDLADILAIADPQGTQQGGGGEPPGMPQSTERQYTRTNVSEKTRSGQDASRITQLLSGNEQGGANGVAKAGVA